MLPEKPVHIHQVCSPQAAFIADGASAGTGPYQRVRSGEPGPQHVHALRERLREDRSSPLLLPPNAPLPVFLLVISSYMNFRRPNSSR